MSIYAFIHLCGVPLWITVSAVSVSHVPVRTITYYLKVYSGQRNRFLCHVALTLLHLRILSRGSHKFATDHNHLFRAKKQLCSSALACSFVFSPHRPTTRFWKSDHVISGRKGERDSSNGIFSVDVSIFTWDAAIICISRDPVGHLILVYAGSIEVYSQLR
jgi:hypothetical protein